MEDPDYKCPICGGGWEKWDSTPYINCSCHNSQSDEPDDKFSTIRRVVIICIVIIAFYVIVPAILNYYGH